ncbi:GlsB/YeaQ/YmgE family stress response membrane protein [Hyphomicrobium sp. NDB2Meth4]|uniref:GlsB/YeaQ/YmgE family stress response membrane protein n=1 Tax=Hyphomicrobium sp. NDB2Meth4 TaxID=1892846 RepID=UPI000930FF98|nr:GlsB/YeaQ/YmgE family stress response membrane protein [Hyphomicrobium sp. NDB2Meth4]
MNVETRALVVFAVIGILAGFLASILIGGGGGILRYLITGIVGAFVGGYLFEALKIDLGIGNKFLSEVVTATVGAVIVVILARIIA